MNRKPIDGLRLSRLEGTELVEDAPESPDIRRPGLFDFQVTYSLDELCRSA